MAVTISLYDHTVKKLVNKEVTLTTLKLELLNNTPTFVAANTTRTSVVGANAVSGNGWAANGQVLTNVLVTITSTNDAKLDADDISVTATGGSIGPAFKALLYDDTPANDDPLAFIDFGGSQEAGVGTPFNVNWNTSGIITFTYT